MHIYVSLEEAGIVMKELKWAGVTVGAVASINLFRVRVERTGSGRGRLEVRFGDAKFFCGELIRAGNGKAVTGRVEFSVFGVREEGTYDFWRLVLRAEADKVTIERAVPAWRSSVEKIGTVPLKGDYHG